MNNCCFKLDKTCSILNEMQCNRCSFRKTKEELEEGRRRALDRIRSLPHFQREYIEQKYGSRRIEDDEA